ncbi:hypothetical protein M405DRAFT_817958 [Rhizopogon salebrosus TDB-379]|nr:hypothetical protein M405DRAFT_817958 [Rhizopogon salebrosus TDB-379]
MNASAESPLPLQDTSSGGASMTDNTPPPSLVQLPLNPNNYVIIIQNNCIAEGGTINIFSGHCTGPAVTKVDHAAPASEPAFLQPPMAIQPVLVERGRDNIILSGNSLGECVMINVNSPNCIGSVKQTALASQVNRSI